MEQYLTAAEVGKILGVHYRMIENWAAQDYLARDEKGRYGLLSALKHQVEQLQKELREIRDNPKAALSLQKLGHEVTERAAIALPQIIEFELIAPVIANKKSPRNGGFLF